MDIFRDTNLYLFSWSFSGFAPGIHATDRLLKRPCSTRSFRYTGEYFLLIAPLLISWFKHVLTWQSCFYVPPSLRPKPSVARTPPGKIFLVCWLPISGYGLLYWYWDCCKTKFHVVMFLVGPRGSFEQQPVKRQPVSLAKAKTFNSHSTPKSNTAFGSGVQRKLDLAKQDATRNTKPVRSSVKDSIYRPPGRKSPCK